MKSLYDHNWRYTDDAQDLDSDAADLLNTLFTKYVKMGYNPREISHVMNGALTQLELENVITKEKV